MGQASLPTTCTSTFRARSDAATSRVLSGARTSAASTRMWRSASRSTQANADPRELGDGVRRRRWRARSRRAAPAGASARRRA